MPNPRRLLFGVSLTVEEREVARRENLFGVVFAEIRHRVGIFERETKFFALSFGGPDFFHQPVRRCGVLLQLRGYLKRRDPIHLRSLEQPRSPLANVKNAASGHSLTFYKIPHREEPRAVPLLDIAF